MFRVFCCTYTMDGLRRGVWGVNSDPFLGGVLYDRQTTLFRSSAVVMLL